MIKSEKRGENTKPMGVPEKGEKQCKGTLPLKSEKVLLQKKKETGIMKQRKRKSEYGEERKKLEVRLRKWLKDGN